MGYDQTKLYHEYDVPTCAKMFLCVDDKTSETIHLLSLHVQIFAILQSQSRPHKSWTHSVGLKLTRH